MKNNRTPYIDCLKVLALSCIILAHVKAPEWIMRIRGFDVPLMVILSSILGEVSYSNNGIGKYYLKRFKRLVFPTWIFLVIYFIYCCFRMVVTYSFRYYLDSFLLTRYGIGYVWIILIYLYVSILVPVFARKTPSRGEAFCLVTIYILYEIACSFRLGMDNRFIDTTVYYFIPYGMLAYIGCNYSHLSKKEKGILFLSSLVSFLISGIYYYRIEYEF